jgi:hypothetical protein
MGSGAKVDGEDFGKLGDAKRSSGYREALQEMKSVNSVRLIDVS